MRLHNVNKVKVLSGVTLLSLAIIGFYAVPMFNNLTGNQISFGIHGWITVKVDGQTRYSAPDLIMTAAYDFVICSAFNDTENNGACSSGSNNANGLLNFNGSPVNTTPKYLCAAYNRDSNPNGNVFLKNTYCTLSAAWLSTDTSTPNTNSPYCYSALSGSGFAPVQVIFSGHPALGGNAITLTATWTATANQAGIDKACLSLWNTVAGHAVDSSGGTGSPYVLTSDIFTAQNINSGQTFQVIWSVSF